MKIIESDPKHQLFQFSQGIINCLVKMLTYRLLSYCNHLLATTVIYITIVDPLKEISNNLDTNLVGKDNVIGHHHRFPSLALADTSTDQDLYEILGVKKDATKHEIHKAFRQLAKKYHPDKNKEKGAQDEFIKIFKAYETLSDEKKRKEYDERGKQGSFNGWQTNGMNDFDMNEFFKQYEDQLHKHAQHFSHHHQHHQQNYNHDRFSFHGVNLDDLFHDIDEDEFPSFGRLFDEFADHGHHMHHSSEMDGSFGDGNSYFGSHFPSQIHDTLHQYQHQQSFHSSGGNRAGYSCHTITKQVNGMMMTQTSCM